MDPNRVWRPLLLFTSHVTLLKLLNLHEPISFLRSQMNYKNTGFLSYFELNRNYEESFIYLPKRMIDPVRDFTYGIST